MDFCVATTKSGRPCSNRAGKNGLCSVHDDGTFQGRCTATTASGRRCRNQAMLKGLCPQHDGSLSARQWLNREMRRGTPVPESPRSAEFVPANQRGATRDEKGRLRSSLDWREERRRLPGQ